MSGLCRLYLYLVYGCVYLRLIFNNILGIQYLYTAQNLGYNNYGNIQWRIIDGVVSTFEDRWSMWNYVAKRTRTLELDAVVSSSPWTGLRRVSTVSGPRSFNSHLCCATEVFCLFLVHTAWTLLTKNGKKGINTSRSSLLDSLSSVVLSTYAYTRGHEQPLT